MDHTKDIENKELVDKLYREGWASLCNLLMYDDTIRTKKGRLKMSNIAHKMNWTQKQTAYAMKRLRELVEEENNGELLDQTA